MLALSLPLVSLHLQLKRQLGHDLLEFIVHRLLVCKLIFLYFFCHLGLQLLLLRNKLAYLVLESLSASFKHVFEALTAGQDTAARMLFVLIARLHFSQLFV